MRWINSFTGFVFLLIAFKGYSQNSNFSGGNGASVFLCNDGQVYTSGANDFGQLGIGNSPGTNAPIVVPGIGNVGTLSYIKQVSGKQENTVVALSSTGDSVITWGNNDRGQLGNNLYGNVITNNNMFPYRVIGANGIGYLTNVKYVASGTQTNYAILSNGKVVAWGSANNGALGNGTNGPDATSPVYVLKGLGDTLNNVKSVVAGTNFAIALLQDGTLWGWGENNIGQLAQNNIVSSPFAVQIKGFGGNGFLSNIVSVTCSQTHVLALSALDTTWAWGNNSTGQFGNNSNSNSLTPVVVLNSLGSAPLRNISAIATGDGFSMALKADSTVLVWGSNTFGMFGNNTTISSLNPAVVLNELGLAPLKHISQISTGKYFAFAKEKSGNILGWGQNSDGQLAMGDFSPRLLPDTVTMPCTWATGPLFVKGIISGPISVCGAINSGTINLSGNNGTIVAWHKSTNDFLNYTIIPSSLSSLAFLNITQKTFYRAVISFNDQLLFSDPISINVDLPSLGGVMSAPASVCEGTNSGLLSLSGQLGSVLLWEYSLDSFATAGVLIANILPTFNYSNLNVTTFYRAIVQNGVCISDTSTVVKITVNPLSIGGTIAPSNTVCFGTNNGTMSLSGHTGDVIGWEYSSDNFTGFVNPLSNSTITETFLNLTVTTYYRAIVKNGACPMVYSSTNIITVDPLSSGGSLTPSAVVCSGSNSGALTLGSYVGNIIGWESSSDNLFTTINPIGNTTPIENFTNLLATTFYRVRVKWCLYRSVFSFCNDYCNFGVKWRRH